MDLVCFRCAASAESDDLGIAIYRMNELLDQILEKTGATAFHAYLTGEDNFRKQIYPEYKANRTQPKPVHLEACRHYAIKEMNAEAEYGLEADDLLGINQTEDTIICSLDKDLLQIPGKHFQWAINGNGWSKDDTFIEQQEADANYHFYKQCLMGDPSDNIKGIPKIGPKTAEKMLAGIFAEQDLFDTVRKAYNNDEEFLKNARCLWILRSDRKDYLEKFNKLANITTHKILRPETKWEGNPIDLGKDWDEDRIDVIGQNGNIGYTDADIQEQV